jgi:hypothetical protein
VLPDYLRRFPLLDALRLRRSRRFARGLTMPEGPLAYRSEHPPEPLTEEEEGLLAFAACAVTGSVLSDLPLAKGQGGNIMAGLVGRTIASGDAAQAVAMILINDAGVHLLKRPIELPPSDLSEVVRLGKAGEYLELYRRCRVRIADQRCEAPRDPPFNIEVNRWAAGASGTTTFLPVDDLSFLYINGLLELFNEETACYVLDDRAGLRPAGLAAFARSRGGHLHNDPASGRLATVQRLELLILDAVTLEQGMMHQNLALMAEAMGLGGFPSFAMHEFGWFEALGFRMGSMPATRYLGGGRLLGLLARLAGKDLPVPYPIGLERGGEVLLRAMSPPYFASMADAVRHVVDRKFGARGCFREPGAGTAWKRGDEITAAVPPVSEKAIDATIAYCEYLWDRYGRFPVNMAPFRTVVRFQAAHLDVGFYDRYYREDALGEAHRRHQERWHSQG